MARGRVAKLDPRTLSGECLRHFILRMCLPTCEPRVRGSNPALAAIAALRPQGGMLHVHANVSATDGEEANWVATMLAQLQLLTVAAGRDWIVRLVHLEYVKWYAPKIRHVVADVQCVATSTSESRSEVPS